MLETEPQTGWSDITRMRDRLAHRYFDTQHSHVAYTVGHDLEPLAEAVTRLFGRTTDGE